jgi:hypothetical protein
MTSYRVSTAGFLPYLDFTGFLPGNIVILSDAPDLISHIYMNHSPSSSNFGAGFLRHLIYSVFTVAIPTHLWAELMVARRVSPRYWIDRSSW